MATLKDFDTETGQCSAQYFYPDQEVTKDGYKLPDPTEYREVGQDKEAKPKRLPFRMRFNNSGKWYFTSW